MMRILLFLATNFAVMLVLGIILNVTGIAGNSTGGILIMAMLFGFAGSLISLFLSKTMALRSVGAEVITEPRNQAERWLVETVRRQAQQAGIPMPDVAIYHSNDANAFATGATKNNSLVAISTGLLNSMTEEEAEAVLAHEVSHIANGDMVTMTLLQGVLNTFVIFLSRVIANVVASSRNGDEESRSSGIYFLVSMVLEILFGILASIIAMWFSRYREYRADAGSAQLKAFLFSGTLAENLKVGKEDATEEERWEALSVAQAREVVEKNEKGLQMKVSEGGTNFSGGQRQRLAIARAIVRRPKIYLFDDSFSALDYRTDQQLRKALKEITGDATVIIVAQRISTIREADMILYIRNKGIAEEGTHEELMKNSRTYQEIVASQPVDKEAEA